MKKFAVVLQIRDQYRHYLTTDNRFSEVESDARQFESKALATIAARKTRSRHAQVVEINVVEDLGHGFNADGTGRTELSDLMDRMFGKR